MSDLKVVYSQDDDVTVDWPALKIEIQVPGQLSSIDVYVPVDRVASEAERLSKLMPTTVVMVSQANVSRMRFVDGELRNVFPMERYYVNVVSVPIPYRGKSYGPNDTL